MKHNARHVFFLTPDRLSLPGLLYEPKRRTKKAVIYLHGLASTKVFYGPDTIAPVAHALNRIGVSYFAFNNRGAHLIHRFRVWKRGRKKTRMQGAAFEKIRDCIYDIDGAIAFLRKRGYSDFTLIGHSTGANKICFYSYLKKRNPVKRYVLLGGGDDTGITYDELGSKKFNTALIKARKMIRARRGEEPVPSEWTGSCFYSYQSFYDVNNPDGLYNTFPFLDVMKGLKLSKKKLFREYKSIRKPTLVVYGSDDEYCFGDVPKCIAILKDQCSVPKQFTFKTIARADHSFTGHERRLGSTIARWMTQSTR